MTDDKLQKKNENEMFFIAFCTCNITLMDLIRFSAQCCEIKYVQYKFFWISVVAWKFEIAVKSVCE